MNVTESTQVAVVASWILGSALATGRTATDHEACEALAALADRAYHRQGAGLTADDVRRMFAQRYLDGDVALSDVARETIGMWTSGELRARAAMAALRDFVNTGRPHYGPRCYICGCTDEVACVSGCSWVPDPDDIGDRCSACTPGVVPLGAAPHGGD